MQQGDSTTIPLNLVAYALGTPFDGDGFDCAICGPSPFGPGGRLGTNFADQALMHDQSSRDTCAGCEAILGGKPGREPPPLRTRSFVVDRSGFRTLDRDGMWAVLSDPPERCVLSWATSGQKHHALRAGMSSSAHLIIGSDDRAIHFVPARDAGLLSSVAGLLALNGKRSWFSRTDIATGGYHPRSVAEFGPARHAVAETIISPYRRGRPALLDLVLWCAPALEPAVPREEEPDVIDPTDAKAAELLGAIARGSAWRAEDGKRFWSGLFESRVRRVTRKPLPDMVARLLHELRVQPASDGAQSAAAILSGLSAEEQSAVERSILERTSLVVTLAYAHRSYAS